MKKMKKTNQEKAAHILIPTLSLIVMLLINRYLCSWREVSAVLNPNSTIRSSPIAAPEMLQRLILSLPKSTVLDRVSLPIPESCYKGNTPFGIDLIRHWWLALQEVYKYAPPSIFPPNHTKRANLTGNEMDFILSSYSSFFNGYSAVGNASYVRIWKNANNAVRCNMKRCFNVESFKQLDVGHRDLDGDAALTTFTYTFVRDPVPRWASGYNEIEFRILSRGIDVAEICINCSFHNFPPGSEERVWAFLHDFLAMNMLTCLHVDCSVDVPNIRHIYPQSGVLKHLMKLDHVNLTDYIGVEWPRLMQEHMKAGQHPQLCQYDKSACQHPSGADPYKTYAAAKSAIRSSPQLEAILQRILVDDYRCFFGLNTI
jgi:hypothetical protein